ncbi:MAG: class I SAM-dependent methyltransferase [Candidatus Pacebacteria bacterium]|nr:class I SAM-dependent methyltransferase [Candidatus Paceibacterota bacterium]
MRKITRGRIRSFLASYATDVLVLDIGSGGANQDASFPNRTTYDIDSARNPSIVGDAQDMPFPDSSYDVIVCSEVLEHIPDPKKAIGEMFRVLAPGGTLILTTRFVFPVHDAPGDYWRFTPYGLRSLFTRWEILEEEVETDAFLTIAVLLQRIMFQTDLRGGKITKGILLLVTYAFTKLDWLLVRRYGDIGRTDTVPVLMSSGVYIACRKEG